jgi:hypothetical protein
MGATEIRRSIFPRGKSSERPIFVGFASSGVSAGFVGILGSLAFAEETQRRQDRLVSSDSIMATIKARRQANGSIRYTAIVRRRVGKFAA